jgi:hypothetical protein
MRINDPESVRTIIQQSRTIAVVGLSSKPTRPSFGVAHYLQSVGYRIIPVNPNETTVLGEPAVSRLSDITEPIDVVEIFRRSEFVGPIVDDAIAIGAKAIWMQEGVVDEEAARRAAAGLLVVMNKCMLKEHRKLTTRPLGG